MYVVHFEFSPEDVDAEAKRNRELLDGKGHQPTRLGVRG